MCRAISRNVITSPTGLKSSSAAGKSSTACAVSCRTVFHDSSTVSVLTIGNYCNHGIEQTFHRRDAEEFKKKGFTARRAIRRCRRRRLMGGGSQESAHVFQHPHDERRPAGL